MQPAVRDIIVVGGGTSTGYLCRGLAINGFEGSVSVIGKENYLPYERPALSKGYLIKGGFPVENFATCAGRGWDKADKAWYDERGMKFHLGSTVDSVDVKTKTVSLSDGSQLRASQFLVLATGSRPTTFADFKIDTSAVKSGIHYLRDVDDADGLIASLKPGKKKVVIIGGGYIGMEAAACLTNHETESITMVFPEKHLMSRAFTPEIAGFYEKKYSDAGVIFCKEDYAVAVNVDATSGAAISVSLNSGKTIEGDVFIVGIGARPNTGMVSGQVNTLDKAPGGIVVNEFMETSEKDVYAIGDIASYPCQYYEDEVSRFEHVHSARETAMTAAASITGKKSGIDYLPFFYSRILDCSWVIYGKNTKECFPYGDQASGKFGAWWVENGLDGKKTVGGFLEGGSDEETLALKEIILSQPAWPPSNTLLEKIGNWI